MHCTLLGERLESRSGRYGRGAGNGKIPEHSDLMKTLPDSSFRGLVTHPKLRYQEN